MRCCRWMTRIAFIGAGSIEFTRDLLGDLLSFPELARADIALHDIDPERLATAEAMARWTADRRGAEPTFSAHLDRRAALDGADFVFNMIQVGGHAATLLDFEIPARYGLRQTIADTLGIGGIFRALRTIPVMLDIGRDMAELCPDAWLLNYTNPMAMLCQAYAHGSPHTKVVGLCHSVQHTTRRSPSTSASRSRRSRSSRRRQPPVVHPALRARRRGPLPAAGRAIAADPELRRKVRVELYRRFGYFPTESSEHSAEYLPWLMRDDAALEHFRVPVDEYVRRSEENLELYEEIKAKLGDGEGFEIERSVEYAALIVHAMATGQPQVIYGNVVNDGLIDNLPAGACVEVPCVVDRNGRAADADRRAARRSWRR